MQCPHCGYEEYTIVQDGSCAGNETRGEDGLMFRLPVKLEREVGWQDWLTEEARLFGCPKCNKVFTGDVYG